MIMIIYGSGSGSSSSSSSSSSSISNGNRTERSPIQSVIIRAINKSDDRVAGVRYV